MYLYIYLYVCITITKQNNNMKKVFLSLLAALVSIFVTGLTNSGFFLFLTIVLIGFAYIQLILTKLNTK